MNSAPTLVYRAPLFLEHDPGPGHPESSSRLERTYALLDRHPVSGTGSSSFAPAPDDLLLKAHSRSLVGRLLALSGRSAQIDPDTRTSPASVEASRLASGAAVHAVGEVVSGRARNAFCLVRPPGHHSGPDRAMGFCLFNHAAVAAEAALGLGLRRVLVLDWDVHHGNGTQDCFVARPEVLYASVHQFPFCPGTGAATDVGAGPGRGLTVNCPLPEGLGDADYGLAFEQLFLPVAREFAPELVLVSAGFDAHRADPLGGMRVTERGFAAMCTALRHLATECAGGRLVLLLEGGYDVDALAASVHACLEVLTGREETFPRGPGQAATSAIAAAVASLRPYWKALAG